MPSVSGFGHAGIEAWHHWSFDWEFPSGGNGASYGGRGGWGQARHPPAEPYNGKVSSLPVVLHRPISYRHSSHPPGPCQQTLFDLVGGSGGSVGGDIPQDVVAFPNPQGRGGDGGGAVEIAAVNDVIIGPSGIISVDGGDAEEGPRGGGGGR